MARGEYSTAEAKEKLEQEILNVQIQAVQEGKEFNLKYLKEKIDKTKYEITLDDEENPTTAVIKEIGSNYYLTVDSKLKVTKVEEKAPKPQHVKFSELTWTSGKASVELSTKEAGTIEYKVGKDGIYQAGTTISNLSNGDIVYARVNNNGTYTEEETLEIKDTILPEEFTITASDITYEGVKVTGSTQDLQTGIKDYTYVAASGDTIVKEIKNQTVTSYEITGLDAGTEYVVYMLAYDNAGNVRKSKEETVKTTKSVSNIYAKLYTDGTLALSSTDVTLTDKTVKNDYGNIKGTSNTLPKWSNNATDIIEVRILDEIVPETCSYWFAYCRNLRNIVNIEKMDISLVNNTSSMFEACSSLQELDLSKLNTRAVTNMSGMFHNVENLIDKLDFGKLDTSSVTNMYSMFSGNSTLKSIDLTDLDTSHVTNMMNMFDNCRSLTSLNLSSFNTSLVTNMDYMFRDCRSLTSLNLSSFNTDSVTNMNYMFDRCSSLTSLNLNSFNTDSVKNMRSMFEGCSNLTSLNLNSFNTGSVTDMGNMFEGCSNLTSLNLSSFNTSSVTNMGHMFDKCSSLTSLNLSSFNTGSVGAMSYMFNGCSSLTSLNLNSFSTSSVVTMIYMFADCPKLKSISVNRSKWVIQKNTETKQMFYNCGTTI